MVSVRAAAVSNANQTIEERCAATSARALEYIRHECLRLPPETDRVTADQVMMAARAEADNVVSCVLRRHDAWFDPWRATLGQETS